MLAPAALSLLATTFTDPAERGKAFGIYAGIAGAGGAIGLQLGGALTEVRDWRWCLYVSIAFAVPGTRLLHHVAILHGCSLNRLRPSPPTRRSFYRP